MGFGDILSGIGSGIADTVTEIGTSIVGAADLVFTVAEDTASNIFGWADEALGPAVNQDTWSAGNLGPDGWGSDGWDNAAQVSTIIEEPISNATFAPSASTAGGGMLSGGLFTKDDLKGAAAAFAKGYFQKQQDDDIMDWRRELELEKIAANKKHHGAYYVGSNVKPAYAKPLEKK